MFVRKIMELQPKKRGVLVLPPRTEGGVVELGYHHLAPIVGGVKIRLAPVYSARINNTIARLCREAVERRGGAISYRIEKTGGGRRVEFYRKPREGAPQSTPLSSPFLTRSVHVGFMHWPLRQYCPGRHARLHAPQLLLLASTFNSQPLPLALIKSPLQSP